MLTPSGSSSISYKVSTSTAIEKPFPPRSHSRSASCPPQPGGEAIHCVLDQFSAHADRAFVVTGLSPDPEYDGDEDGTIPPTAVYIHEESCGWLTHEAQQLLQAYAPRINRLYYTYCCLERVAEILDKAIDSINEDVATIESGEFDQ